MARKLLKTNDSAWLFAEKSKTPMQVGLLANLSVPEDQPSLQRIAVHSGEELDKLETALGVI